jgi:hypothetical protein
LANKLKDCRVFGVSSDELLDYALDNRTEWEARGHEIVARMLEEAELKHGDLFSRECLIQRFQSGLPVLSDEEQDDGCSTDIETQPVKESSTTQQQELASDDFSRRNVAVGIPDGSTSDSTGCVSADSGHDQLFDPIEHGSSFQVSAFHSTSRQYGKDSLVVDRRFL